MMFTHVYQLKFMIMKKLLLFITIFTFAMSANVAFAQKGNGNGKSKAAVVTNSGSKNTGAVVLNRPVRRVYVTPANRYGRRNVAVRSNNGKHKGWYKGKAKRRVNR